MKANNLPEGISIAGNDFLIIDNGKETKRVALDKTTEFFRGEIFGGGAAPYLQPYIRNRNIADNWYFLALVNQKRQQEYTAPGYNGYYGIDRWGQYNKTKLTISEDGVSLFYPGDADGGTYILGQPVEDFKALRGETMTLSLLVSSLSQGEIDLFVQFHEDYEGNVEGDITAEAGLLSVTFQVPMDAEMMLFGINAPNKNPCAFSPVAMKLELGPRQTLAHQDASGNWVLNDPPPNKALELLKCQRYFLRLPYNHLETVGTLTSVPTWLNLQIALPATMRLKNPTVTVTCALSCAKLTGNLLPSITNAQVSGANINIGFAYSGDVIFGYVYAGQAGYIDLDCNL